MALGYTFSAHTLGQVLAACERGASVAWEPTFFTQNEAALLAEITETILPPTETPGAKEVGVPQFVDQMAKLLLDTADQDRLKEGLRTVDAQSHTLYGKGFLACTPEEREAILATFDGLSPSPPLVLWGILLDENPPPSPFFQQIKSLSLLGYFTSERVGKELLRYDPVPGGYQGCIPYQGENSWTE